MPTLRHFIGFYFALSASWLAAAAPERGVIQSLVQRQAHAWETGDETEFLATLAPDVVFAYPGKRLDRTGALNVFRDWQRDFHDTHLRIHRLVIDGESFSVEYLFTSTNAATGKKMAAGTVAVGETHHGLISVWKEYLDGRVSRGQAAGELPVAVDAEPFPWPDTPESRKP